MQALPEPGTLISEKYRIETLLGEGGMGAVYRARHILMDKEVALKWLQPGLASHPEARDRFVREARAAARIRHPNVVDVYDVGQHGDALFMVMELLEGNNLAELLRARRLPLLVLLSLLTDAMRGVSAAHAAGIIHRDIKPENVFIMHGPAHPAGIAKILDFGISKLQSDGTGAGLTVTGMAMGTPAYMSREQMGGAKDVDCRADVYSFGVILYQVLTGVSPFEGDSFADVAVKVATFRPPPPSELRPGLPRSLDLVVMRAMTVRREDRYASMDELIDALSQVLQQEEHGGLAEAITLPQQRMPEGVENRLDSMAPSTGRQGYAPTPTTQDFPRPLGPRTLGGRVGLAVCVAVVIGGLASLLYPRDEPPVAAPSVEPAAPAPSSPDDATAAAAASTAPAAAAAEVDDALFDAPEATAPEAAAPDPAREPPKARKRTKKRALRKPKRSRAARPKAPVPAEVEAAAAPAPPPTQQVQDAPDHDFHVRPSRPRSRSGTLSSDQF